MRIVAAILVALLAVSGAAFATFTVMVGDGEGAAPLHEEARHAAGHAAPAAGAHPWSGGTGAIPTLLDAVTKLERRQTIVIEGDDAFNPANGVRSGSGTFSDPFVISGWYVDVIHVKDTSKAFEIKENYVGSILILDWNGRGGYVHHNHLDNLRTNRNVERTGDPTAAVIEHNEIGRVEELRHFDGELRNNTIGDPSILGTLDRGVALNIAGLNGAGIHDNLIHGGVDMKIHGHHHSDHHGAHSHNHGEPDEAQAEDHAEDHQVRFVDFQFYKNHIVDDGFGLRYNDLNHAGDDRTATSEQEPMLEKPHVHHTTVRVHDNVIEGSTLRIVGLNSVDERHVPGESGRLEIHDNRILKPAAGDGLVVQDVRNATVAIRGNVVEKGQLQLAGTSAILLARFANSTVEVDGNAFGDYRYGVRAAGFDERTNWTVGENRGAVRYPIYWDDSVANPPAGHAEAEDGHAGHEHGARAAGRSEETVLSRTGLLGNR